MKKIVLLLFLFILILFIFVFFHEKRDISATDSNVSITTEPSWSAGVLENITAFTPAGSISINDKTQVAIDLEINERYSENSSLFSLCVDPDNFTNIFDENDTTRWGHTGLFVGHECWDAPPLYGGDVAFQVDLENQETITNAWYLGTAHAIQVSADEEFTDPSIDSLPASTDWDGNILTPAQMYDFTSPMTGRYIKIHSDGLFIHELKLYTSKATGTHITAPTQIDGQEGDENKKVIEWTSFEATDSIPANTSITYEYRVSDDAETWTEWTEDFSSLDNQRYLQVKATMTTADPLVTPQIDDYTINFHNNLPPNKPTAQTAVIGD